MPNGFRLAQLLGSSHFSLATASPLSVQSPPVNGDRLTGCWSAPSPRGGVAAPNRSRGHRWSARSNARTNDLGAGEERRMLGRRGKVARVSAPRSPLSPSGGDRLVRAGAQPYLGARTNQGPATR